MELIEQVSNFLNRPMPLWENGLTSLLVLDKSQQLNLIKADYNIENCVLRQVKTKALIFDIAGTEIKIEAPTDTLNNFYDSHGLEPLSELLIHKLGVDTKISDTLNMLALIPAISDFLKNIVKTIQVIRPENEETDISYSHPEIPFSIFVSVCEASSLRSTLRVAESILHEAMHLKLTLVENILPLIQPFSGNVFFSPWRDEKRPARGVLHGLFVFRAILDYFTTIIDRPEVKPERPYIESRIAQIKTDLSQLKDFASCIDLTKDGAILTKNLLPSS
ncbi:aKG-HExxH-type peptide beta-hydroxylase [Pedobacter miscanthi]|uniref:aKG-HExxH-type peptide beta-hydroxylase n=1 Tax=Pedobacter miscanthi TaxID=2259170 RepID=UPI002930CDE8|nr:HEXXH motif-containing putative peptide modification protein [Pedobacter miscanthi]